MSSYDIKQQLHGGGTVTLDAPYVAPGNPLPGSADYPRASVPVGTLLSFASFGSLASWCVPAPPSILDAGDIRYVTSGRIAIALALRQMGVGPGTKVLVPAYHCASMVEPVIWAGATPVFYHINADTSVNLADLARRIDSGCRVVMATNYFGFPQNLSAIRALCDANGLQLLEDCAHSFLGQHQGKPLGSWGDYAIASSMKFYPIYEGGCLVSARHSLASIQLRSAGLGFESKSAVNALEDGFAYQRLGLLRGLLWLPMQLKSLLWHQIKRRRGADAPPLSPGSSDGGFGLDPEWLDKRSSLFSRLMLKLVSRRRMGALRRRNYLRLQQALQGLPGCRPLFERLPDAVYPWVFPLLTDDPQRLFRTLKMAGVPIIRFGEYLWPGVDCAHSHELSRRVLQFPCHQELRASEIEWIIAHIKQALTAEPTP